MKLAIVGDIGIDAYVNKKLQKPGGIGFNVCVHASLGGANVSLISALGGNAVAKKLKHLLEALSINMSHVQDLPGETPVQNILLQDSGEREFVGYTAGILKDWKLKASDLAFIATHDAIFVPLSDGMKQEFKKIAKLKTTAIKAVDFSQDSEYADFDKKDNVITKYSTYFDVIFVGGTEKQIPLLQLLSKKYPKKVFVLTLGGKGSIGFVNGEKFIQPAKKVKNIVDTTGAGDAFQAKFLVNYYGKHELTHALLKASEYAATVIQYIGSTRSVLSNYYAKTKKNI